MKTDLINNFVHRELSEPFNLKLEGSTLLIACPECNVTHVVDKMDWLEMCNKHIQLFCKGCGNFRYTYFELPKTPKEKLN